ncbi:putative oxidoreductase [Roseimicrobium gellanilyticum]|uniref:Putative oxidoreductase n=1 Tax=Roseimicrobium gellanilyticum TaxID=748857 RepID=A0A366HPH6_9BACT|nr:DoxX family protein [Roseimicrobium gellanilyticum]RBP44360.1 putative oxidoreductase [Roseimicrobium gellanilyticum]
MNKLIKLDFVPFSTDLGLLVLRAWLGLSMFALHGLAKLKNFGGTVQMFNEKMGFPTPLGAAAVLAESAFAILLVIGLGTRWAASFLAVTMAVAFFMAHQGSFDPKSATGSGELAFIYLAGFVALLISGAGRYSVDAKLK